MRMADPGGGSGRRREETILPPSRSYDLSEVADARCPPMITFQRGCSCGGNACDVCGRRCPLSLTDGWQVSCPVRADDGQMYEMSALFDWARRCKLQSRPVEIIPTRPIRSFCFLRLPFDDLLRRARRAWEMWGGAVRRACKVWGRRCEELLERHRKRRRARRRPAVREEGRVDAQQQRSHPEEEWWGSTAPDAFFVCPVPLRARTTHPFPRRVSALAPVAVHRWVTGF